MTIGENDWKPHLNSWLTSITSTTQSAGPIIAGPDGALWFLTGGNTIGRITTSGVVSAFTGPGIASPVDIVDGPDGALWFTNEGNNSIGRITTSGIVTDFTDPTITNPSGLAVGPDGALWFTNKGTNSGGTFVGSSIGRITTDGVVSNYTVPSISAADAITAGPDGALWFEDGNSIGRISTSGAVQHFVGEISTPRGITTGPDGALWYANSGNNTIGRLTPRRNGLRIHRSQHQPSRGDHPRARRCPLVHQREPQFDRTHHHRPAWYRTTPIPASIIPEWITAGPDGALWFTNENNNSIGRITTGGVVTNYTDPSFNFPDGITAGPDGALWFTNAGQ